jgi:hypothetical protein
MSTSDFSDHPPNPYQSPAEASGSPLGQLELASGSRIVSLLRQTRPWVRFLSVLGFIVAALLLIGAVIGLIVSATTQGPAESVMFVIYLACAMLYIVPSVYLFRFADRIADLERTGRVESLVNALEAQKSFWRFVGIMAVVVMVIYGLGIMAMLLFGLGMAATG